MLQSLKAEMAQQEMREGARIAVRTCMAVQPSDRVFIWTDDKTAEIGHLMAAEARQITPHVLVKHLESYSPRPITAVPEALLDDLDTVKPTVTFFVAQGQPGEVSFRIQLGGLLRNRYKTRHAHMVGIDAQLMREGMRVDYNVIADLTFRVNNRVENAEEIRVTSRKGTDLVVKLDPQHLKWIPCHGLYHHQGDWGNLPEGETFTAPLSADGVIVADVLGDYFSHKYGVLDTPVAFRLVAGRVTAVESANQDLADEVWAYLHSAENGNRAGEFAIGTNIGITHLTGNLLQDEKIPGVHVAFGNPYPDRTGADWTSTIHVDVIPLDCSIWVNGDQIMQDGKFTSLVMVE